MVLPDRRYPTHPVLLSRSSLPLFVLALRQHPHRTVRNRLRSKRQGRHLYIVGPCRIHLPVVHEAVPLPLVATIQLSSRSGTGCWGHHRPLCDLLFAPNAG